MVQWRVEQAVPRQLMERRKRTFPHEIGPRHACPYGRLVAQVRVRHEGLVQPRPEVDVALGVVLAEVEEF